MSRRPTTAELGLNRLHIFVPAIMSVGLVFWFVEVVRDALRWRGARSRERRSRLCGHVVAEQTVGASGATSTARTGMHPRTSYAIWAAVFVAAAVYIAIGSLLNYTRVGGYVSSIAWLLALALVISLALGFVGGLSAALWLRWSDPPAWLRALAFHTPLVAAPPDSEEAPRVPSWALSTALVVTSIAAGVFALLVGASTDVVQGVDDSVSRALRDNGVLDGLRFLDPLGSTRVSLALAVVIGLAALRCRPLAATFVGSIALGLVLHNVIGGVVDRPRPVAGVPGSSFPSGHVLQGAILAGLLPVAFVAITGRRRIDLPLRVVLVAGVAAGAVHRVSIGAHWPSDVVGAALIGTAIALGSWWIIGHERWHAGCRGCVWAPSGHQRARRGAVRIAEHRLPTIRVIAHLAAAVAAVGLVVLTLTIGVPADPEGAGFGSQIATPIQLGLAALVSIGALIAWKWDGVGAVLIALAAGGLGIFAGVEYAPHIALGLTIVLALPAVLLWIGWQHRHSWVEIVGLAVFTALLLGTTGFGVQRVNDYFFGPTHPESEAADLPVDHVEWVWTGGVHSEGISIAAQLSDDAATAEIVIGSGTAAPVRLGPLDPDDQGVVRAIAEGLEPDTEYSFDVVVDGDPDETRGRGSFTTPGDGAYSFRVALSSCARVGSNGRVFDAIAAADPLLYLAMGDIHYSNIGENSPTAFRVAYDRLLTEPGQAALYRQVPTAYVWDDHDYGPNDGDSSSPSRPAARQVYREVVPHYGVEPGDAPINQAFTIGRVRFVMTDNRSERTADSMLGARQLEWLIGELTQSSRTHALVVWVNPVPWIAEPLEGGDNWSGYATERTFIADAIADAEIDNLIMVSGDAHMIALDDGTNSDYSTNGGAGFPVFHAAPLDRPGNVKGGPYSDGAFDGSGQFGLLDIDDGGATISVTITGTNWDGDVLVQRTFDVLVDLDLDLTPTP